MPQFELSGRRSFQLKNLYALWQSSFAVSLRRLARGPLLPNWSWNLEVGTHVARTQTRIAFDMPNILDGREFEDALTVHSPAVAQVTIEPVRQPVKGHWYQPKSKAHDVTVLYLHGGGYAYYAKAHQNLIALVTLAAGSRTFALDYRLIPEHSFPAQLEDALAAYRWLLESGVNPQRLVIAGDSAGGNLTLALLLSLRDASLPLPALGVCLCPWTDVSNPGDSMTRNAKYDILEKRMADQWAKWLCAGADMRNPLISPIHANLCGLPPIYVQAGSAEILYDMICAFAEKGKKQGANISLEVWKNMNHDFQAFGEMTAESGAALTRVGQVIHETISDA